MKYKQRLHGFTTNDQEMEMAIDSEVPRHLPTTYEGVFDPESAPADCYCNTKPSQCIQGVFDQNFLNRNVRSLD